MSGKIMTKQQLCDAVYQAVFSAEKPLSRLEICEAINRHKSPHIVQMIERLYHARWFERKTEVDHRGFGYFVYSVEGAERKHGACEEMA